MVLKDGVLDLLASGFQGVEKNLEIALYVNSANSNALSIKKSEWEKVLLLCNCSILSEISRKNCRAYLLSESSLIIQKNNIRFKTSGTTPLLECLIELLELLKLYNLKVVFIQYERSNFLFTERQPLINRAFTMESQFLKTIWNIGQSFIIGTRNEPTYHVFTADVEPELSLGDDQEIEIIMFDLDPSVLSEFQIKNNSTAKKMINNSGLHKILDPNCITTSYAYDPCGLSITALGSNLEYYTIHVTPEDTFSHVTYRSSLKCENYTALVKDVLKVFRPNKFVVMLYIEENSPKIINTAINEIENYSCKGRSYQEISKTYRGLCLQYESNATINNNSKNNNNNNNNDNNNNIMNNNNVKVSSTDNVSSFGKDALSRRSEAKEQLKMDIDSGNDRLICVGFNLAKTLTKSMICELMCRSIRLSPHVDANHVITTMNKYNKLEELIKTLETTDSTFIINVDKLAERFYQWCVALPRCRPYFELACNGDLGVMSALNSVGCGFSCVSMHDIQRALDFGVSSHRILFEKAWKGITRMRYACDKNIPILSFSHINELRLASKYYPSASLLLHIGAKNTTPIWESPNGDIACGTKFDECKELLLYAINMKCNLIGVRLSFSNDKDSLSLEEFEENIVLAANIMKFASDIQNKNNMNVILISGIGLWIRLKDISKIEISKVFDKYFDQNIRILCEPSRYLVTECTTLVVTVIGRRRLSENNQTKYIYYISDGLYGSLSSVLYEKRIVIPKTFKETSETKYFSRLFGPTCDTVDSIGKDILLPELQLGDKIYFESMGAYAASKATAFNGIKRPDVWYISNNNI